MNFADALRQAKQQTGEKVLPEPYSVPEAGALTVEPATIVDSSPEVAHEPQAPAGNVVRLELFLTPEQISSLFRAVVASQHSVMTLREAANHLRVPHQALEELAKSGEVPAFVVDGRWRFPRAGLDEWLGMQTSKKEAS